MQSAPAKDTDTKTDTPAETKTEETKPSFSMPNLETGPQSFFDEKSGAFWVGLPTATIDYITASAILDRCKLDVLSLYQKRVMDANKKIIKPQGLRGLIEKLNPLKK